MTAGRFNVDCVIILIRSVERYRLKLDLHVGGNTKRCYRRGLSSSVTTATVVVKTVNR